MRDEPRRELPDIIVLLVDSTPGYKGSTMKRVAALATMVVFIYLYFQVIDNVVLAVTCVIVITLAAVIILNLLPAPRLARLRKEKIDEKIHRGHAETRH